MRVRNRADARERLENSPVVFLQPKDNKGKWKKYLEIKIQFILK